MQSFPGRTKFVPASHKHRVPRRRKDIPPQKLYGKLTTRERREMAEILAAREELVRAFESGTSKF